MVNHFASEILKSICLLTYPFLYILKLLTRQKQNLEERLKRQRDKHRQRVEESENKLVALQKDYEKIQEEIKEYELKAAEEKRSHDEIQEKVRNFIFFNFIFFYLY